MKKLIAGLAALALAGPIALAQMPGQAMPGQQAAPAGKSPDQLAQCLIQNTQESDKQTMRDFMIAALQQQKEAATEKMMSFGMSIAMKATTSCGWTMQELQTPQFEQAVTVYGEFMGEQIMAEAMGGMGLQ